MKNLDTDEIGRYYCPERISKEREGHYKKTGFVKDTVVYYWNAKSRQGKEYHNFDLVSSAEYKELEETFNLNVWFPLSWTVSRVDDGSVFINPNIALKDIYRSDFAEIFLYKVENRECFGYFFEVGDWFFLFFFLFFQAEDGIRDIGVTGVQTCALPISPISVGTNFAL